MALVAGEKSNNKAAVNDTLEIFLQSGELYFGGAPTIISTMLHSRTVITFWHPKAKIGGMSHMLMPVSPDGKYDLHYGDCAITEFAKQAAKYKTPTNEYEVRVYGRMYDIGDDASDEENARHNIDKIKQLLKQSGFVITELDVIEDGSRKLKLDMTSGYVDKRLIKKEPAIKKDVPKSDEFALEIFLHPGDIYFGRAPTIISTLLGSCVAATLWHPKAKLGGMCHIILPDSGGRSCEMKYGDCAIAEFAKQAAKFATKTSDYEVHIYGGSDMFPDMEKSDGMKIGERNIEKVKELLKLYKFHIVEIDTGGSNSRKIKLDLSDGSVGIRKTSKPVEG